MGDVPEIVLSFDPTKIKAETLRRVWDNERARTIWLIWKRCHIVSQHFDEACLKIAAQVGKEIAAGSFDARRMALIMRVDGGLDFNCPSADEYADILAPYMRGHRQVAYRVAPHDGPHEV